MKEKKHYDFGNTHVIGVITNKGLKMLTPGPPKGILKLKNLSVFSGVKSAGKKII